MGTLADLRADLAARADPRRAEGVARYLRMVPGGYGEGDTALGIPVPEQRAVAGRYWRDLTLAETAELLADGVHEERLTAVFVLVRKFDRADAGERDRIVGTMLANLDHLDNWDLVDSSAPYLLGPWLLDRDRGVLDRLAGSAVVWERRTAVLATLAFIRAGEFDWTFRLAERLLPDPHDLVHKAVGWMLREVGKRDRAAEEDFLARHYRRMPRTMLRYAIERFAPARRTAYLTGTAPYHGE